MKSINNETEFKGWFLDWLFQGRDVHTVNIDLSDSPGIPDTNYCSQGIEGWFEFKWIGKKGAKIRPKQVQWFRERALTVGRAHVIWGTGRGETFSFGAIRGEDVWKIGGCLRQNMVGGLSMPGLHCNTDQYIWYDALIGERN